MKRERSDSGAGTSRRGNAASSGSGGARKRGGSSAKTKAAAGPGRKRAVKKAAPAAKPRARKSAAAKTAAAPAAAAKSAAAKTKAAKPGPARPAASGQTSRAASVRPAAATAGGKGSTARAVKPRAPRDAASRRKAKPARPDTPPPPAASKRPAERRTTPARAITHKGPADVTDEERVESAKYITGGQPRVFEEERFIFPETYGRTRVRLLVKDPQWLFAHWDVDPAVYAALRGELGDRAAALSRLTLKVTDPEHGGGAVIHLPEDARSWYVRADRVRRAYRAELGITLPSGDYRMLASSGLVRPPQGSASHRRAMRRARYAGPRRTPVGASGWADSEAGWTETEDGGESAAERKAGGRAARPGPWEPTLVESRPRGGTSGVDAGGPDTAGEKGGASDVYRPPLSGASDLYRR
jgi:hypothetical protein